MRHTISGIYRKNNGYYKKMNNLTQNVRPLVFFKKYEYFLLYMTVMANNWQFCDCA
jgi:hypothetical protein